MEAEEFCEYPLIIKILNKYHNYIIHGVCLLLNDVSVNVLYSV